MGQNLTYFLCFRFGSKMKLFVTFLLIFSTFQNIEPSCIQTCDRNHSVYYKDDPSSYHYIKSYRTKEALFLHCELTDNNSPDKLFSINKSLCQAESENMQHKFSKITLVSMCSIVIHISGLNTIPPNFFPKIYYKNREIPVLQIFLDKIKLKYILPGAFNHVQNIRELYLEENNLEDIPEGVFSSLNNLLYLNLGNNKLSFLHDDTFVGADQLVFLYLNNNKLISLSDGLFKIFHELQFLDISYNPLQTVDLTLLSLRYLYAMNVGLSDISQNIYYTNLINLLNNENSNNISIKLNKTSVEILLLGENEISRLKFNLNNTEQLEVLNFTSNLINVLNEDAFSGLNKLAELYLRENKISLLPHGIFRDLSSLKILDLSQNNIQTVPYGLFDSLVSLKTVNLSTNSISRLNSYSFLNSEKLSFLYLDNNKLETVELDYLNDLKEISLDNNYWKCEGLVQIIHKLEHKGSSDVNVISGTTIKGKHNINNIACDENTEKNLISEEKTSSVTIYLVIITIVLFLNSFILGIFLYKFFFNRNMRQYNNDSRSEVELL